MFIGPSKIIKGLNSATKAVSFFNPKRPGSRGGVAHQTKVEQRIKELKDQGHTHLNGGRKKEEVVRIENGHKPIRRPDITTKDPSGNIYRENVGKSKLDRTAIAREIRAIEDLEKLGGGGSVGYTPYDR